MLTKNLISTDIIPLRTSDTGEQAIATMNVFHVRHLPIVNHEMLLGMISEDDILNFNLDEAIGSYLTAFTGHFCTEKDHIFEAMQKMGDFRLSVIPVIDRDEKYLGMITLENILHFFTKNYGLSEPGSILMLERDRSDYSLSEISRIIEGEGGVIIASFINTNVLSSKLQISLKISTNSLGRIIASLQRFEYTLIGTFTKEEYEDGMKHRYDSLMTYLNL